MSAAGTSIMTTLRRRRGMTEQAATAAVDQACCRLQMPTIHAVIDEAVTTAKKECDLPRISRGAIAGRVR